MFMAFDTAQRQIDIGQSCAIRVLILGVLNQRFRIPAKVGAIELVFGIVEDFPFRLLAEPHEIVRMLGQRVEFLSMGSAIARQSASWVALPLAG